eukprot:TRINITY_DN23859_c0_g2_i1.p1 TRINITY_DN23859_c0_g2~~TRINITY_DN23859_c0_g2_i1.p1  ORF type:complete len:341 (+),score=30.72 TRINITY_DN23859_c0_g2_i1:140-1024(+)
MSNVAFAYENEMCLSNMNLSVQQGKIVAVVGEHGSGRNTFLRLLAHRCFPTSGEIFVPTHLRILFVAQNPLLLQASLWENLTFGYPKMKDVGHVRDVLRELRMIKLIRLIDQDRSLLAPQKSPRQKKTSQGLTANSRQLELSRAVSDYMPLEQEDSDDLEDACCGCFASEEEEFETPESFEWISKLTYTDMVRISLARALIMNPEVLVLHRPFHHYDAETANYVLQVIKQHHRNRGLCMSEREAVNRRPRTTFLIPESVDQAKQADVIWQIDSARKSAYEISPYMLRSDFSPPG